MKEGEEFHRSNNLGIKLQCFHCIAWHKSRISANNTKNSHKSCCLEIRILLENSCFFHSQCRNRHFGEKVYLEMSNTVPSYHTVCRECLGDFIKRPNFLTAELCYLVDGITDTCYRENNSWNAWEKKLYMCTHGRNSEFSLTSLGVQF